jgi:hypothetical protein
MHSRSTYTNSRLSNDMPVYHTTYKILCGYGMLAISDLRQIAFKLQQRLVVFFTLD